MKVISRPKAVLLEWIEKAKSGDSEEFVIDEKKVKVEIED